MDATPPPLHKVSDLVQGRPSPQILCYLLNSEIAAPLCKGGVSSSCAGLTFGRDFVLVDELGCVKRQVTSAVPPCLFDLAMQVCEDYCNARDKKFFALQWGQE